MSDTTTDFSKLRFAKPDRIALPDVSIETNQIASNLRELVLVSENFTNLVREVGRIICRETECLAVWASQFNSQTGQTGSSQPDRPGRKCRSQCCGATNCSA